MKQSQEKKTMNKKAGAFAVVVWMTSVIVIVFFLGAYVYMHHELTQALINTHVDTAIVNLTDAAQKTIVQVDNAMGSLHWISFILIIMLAFGILVENFYVRAHPIVFGIHIIVILVAMAGSLYISNYYETLINSGNILSSTLQGFQASSFIVLYLPYFVAVIGIFGLILLTINANRDPEIRRSGL